MPKFIKILFALVFALIALPAVAVPSPSDNATYESSPDSQGDFTPSGESRIVSKAFCNDPVKVGWFHYEIACTTPEVMTGYDFGGGGVTFNQIEFRWEIVLLPAAMFLMALSILYARLYGVCGEVAHFTAASATAVLVASAFLLEYISPTIFPFVHIAIGGAVTAGVCAVLSAIGGRQKQFYAWAFIFEGFAAIYFFFIW